MITLERGKNPWKPIYVEGNRKDCRHWDSLKWGFKKNSDSYFLASERWWSVCVCVCCKNFHCKNSYSSGQEQDITFWILDSRNFSHFLANSPSCTIPSWLVDFLSLWFFLKFSSSLWKIYASVCWQERAIINCVN